MPPIEALIIVILNGPGACLARNAASTLVCAAFLDTLVLAATASKAVSLADGVSPPRCQGTGWSSTGTIPPVDSSSPAIQVSRRTSPSVKILMPAARWSSIASSAARSSSSPSSSAVSVPRLRAARASSSQAGRSRLPTCSAW